LGTIGGIVWDEIAVFQHIASRNVDEVCVISRWDVCRLSYIDQERAVLVIDGEKERLNDSLGETVKEPEKKEHGSQAITSHPRMNLLYQLALESHDKGKSKQLCTTNKGLALNEEKSKNHGSSCERLEGGDQPR
jgi:hypothetical protein